MTDHEQMQLELSSGVHLSDVEKKMWKNTEVVQSVEMTVDEINAKYEKGEQRIVTESNRERLPNFVSALNDRKYMDLRPFYQRRSRWTEEQQSKLIESFIINVPIPPVFLYEREFNSYEVMDGQQRITAIKDFYGNRFKLKNLDLWPELNGMSYAELPSKVKAGIDRRSLSSIVLLKESAPDDEESIFIRQLVFERLNTGGVKLEYQEVRNCLYKSKFNDLLFELAKNSIFRFAWSLPEYTKEEENMEISLPIHEKPFYKKMDDTEMILRFFALRNADHYVKGMRGFLDIYMLRMAKSTDLDLDVLGSIFNETIELAGKIYGKYLFKPFDPVKKAWHKNCSKAFFDAVMVGLSCVLDNKSTIEKRSDEVLGETMKLFERFREGELTGRGNSKNDILNRIGIYRNMLEKFI